MADKLIYTPNNDFSYVNYNYWFKSLDTQLNESSNQNSSKVSRVENPTNTKTLLKTLGTSLIKRPCPSFLAPTCTVYIQYVINYIKLQIKTQASLIFTF